MHKDECSLSTARGLKHDQLSDEQIVGDQSLDAKIREQINHAARVRESLVHLSRSKTNLEKATYHQAIPGTEVGTGEHVIPEFKRNH